MRSMGCRCVPTLALVGLGLVEPLLAAEALTQVSLFDDGWPHTSFAGEPDPARIDRAWPFCPTDRMPCSETTLAWVQMAISIDAYSKWRNDPHDSVEHIVRSTQQDLRPLVEALRQHFFVRSITSDLSRIAFVQGLVKAISYSRDVETGWTEYPKFGLEFLVDEQGDCDDAALTHAVLLEGLGYEVYIVDWDSTTPGGEGHLSTAVRPDRGDLTTATPPSDSRWVEVKGMPRLLHVDATGSTGGCGAAGKVCSPLGWNEWHEEGLEVAGLARPSDPELARRIPLSAWKNGGRERPNRKLLTRRTATDQEIRQEVQDRRLHQTRLIERLRTLGLDPARLGIRLVPARPIPAWQFYSILGGCCSFLLALASHTWRRRRERLARVAAQKLKSEQRGL